MSKGGTEGREGFKGCVRDYNQKFRPDFFVEWSSVRIHGY